MRARYLFTTSQVVVAVTPAVVVVCAVFVIPVVSFLFSIGASLLTSVVRVAIEPLFRRVFLQTAIITVGSVGIAVAIGCAYAAVVYFAGGRARSVFLFAALLPFSAGLLARIVAFTLLLERNGVVNRVLMSAGLISEPLRILYTTKGVVLGMSYVFIPYAVLIFFTTLIRIESNIITAATAAGASPWRRFATIELPLSKHSIVTISGLLGMLAAGFYVTPALLGGGNDLTVATLIEQNVNRLLDWPTAAALAIHLLLIVGAIGLSTVFVGGWQNIWGGESA